MAIPNRKDKDLVEAAKTFATEFGASFAAQTSPTAFAANSGHSLGAAGVIEITEPVAAAQAALRARAMKLLGSKSGHEKAVDDALLKEAHASIVAGRTVDEAAKALIDAVFDRALTTYEYVACNRLFRFAHGVTDIVIGPVRAMKTSDLSAQRLATYPDSKAMLVTEKNDYVRVRYMVVEVPGDIPSVKVLRLVDAVRECVRRGLGYDELGRPVAATTATKKPRRRLQSGRGNRTTQTAT